MDLLTRQGCLDEEAYPNDALKALQAAALQHRFPFSPKDDTPGCTREACDFRDEHSALEKTGAVVLGVSPDDTKCHQKVATKFSLPFPLPADTEGKVCDAYGAGARSRCTAGSSWA